MPGYADVVVCGFCGSTLSRERAAGPTGTASEVTGAAARAPAVEDVAALTEGVPTEGPPAEVALRSVQCSQCAGPLSAREGRRILVCRHCGTRVAVRPHGGVSRWYFPARVDRREAAAAGVEWLRRYPGIAQRMRSARLVEAQLVYAPVWEYRTLLTGWEFGHKVRTQTELVTPLLSLGSGSGLHSEGERLELRLVKQGVKEPRLQERRFYQAAADFEALGATRPRVTGRELLLPLLAGELDPGATVLQAGEDGMAVAERGRRSVLQPLSGAVSPDSHLFTFRERVSLLYYPLWVARYRAGHRSCKIVVDGRDGTVNSAVAPADDRRQLIALAAQILAAVIVVGLLVWLAVTWEGARMPVAAAAVIVSVGAALSLMRFRLVEEVEYHEPFSG
jgi:DNA-directed RNA polymerase subunit RPC12/RpoP